MKKGLLALLLILSLAVCLFACGEKTPDTPGETTGAPTNEFTYEALAEYTVVFTDGDQISFDAAMAIKAAIDAKTSSSLRVSSMPEAGTEAKQIIVGDSEVAASFGIEASAKYYDYVIAVRDNLIFMCAQSEAAATSAKDYVISCLTDTGLAVADYSYTHTYAYSEMSINGVDISEYEINAPKASSADAQLIYNAILEKCGVALKITTEKEGRAIVLASSDEVAFNTAEIAASGDDITVSGNGINGTYLGALAFCEALEESVTEGKIAMTVSEKIEKDVSEYTEGLSSYKFFDENGNLDVNGDGKINIAFIGGSLTQNRNAWTDPVANWFRKTFPNKTVSYINAGIGATNSEFAAARLEHDVFEKMIPDVLFVEFAVNDGGYTNRDDAAIIKNGAYIESIVKQCRELENKPVVIFLYAPFGERKGNSTYDRWRNGTHLKGQIADNYGISSVDIWSHFENLYLEQIKTKPDLSYNDFLLQYYAPTDMLHPTDVGFAIYGDAIVNALSASPEKFLMNKINASTYLTKFTHITDLDYNLIAPDDTRLTLEGNFKHYKGANSYEYGDPRAVTAGKVADNQLADGVIQIEDGVGTITFESSADVIKLYGINSSKGMILDVLCDGEKVGEISTNSNNDYLYMKGVDIPDDGKDTHTITITPAAENADNYVFRIGYIVEAFR